MRFVTSNLLQSFVIHITGVLKQNILGFNERKAERERDEKVGISGKSYLQE